MDNNRVVVTGMGVVSPVGSTLDSFWDSLINGKSGVTKITSFDTSNYPAKIAGIVKDYNKEDFIDRKEAGRMDPFVQYAMGASVMASTHSKLDFDKVDANQVGVIIGSGVGGLITFEDQYKKLLDRGPKRVSPFFIPMMISDMASGQVSIRLGAKGPNYACVSACASAAHSIADAYRTIKAGESQVVFAGGAEAAICPSGIAGFCSAKALSTRDVPPEEASCPFDKRRDGFIMGEGAGMIVLESLEHAKQRGATIYAEMSGYGLSADASHITAPAPGGEGAVRAIKAALKLGNVPLDEVDYINAHGTSTSLNDKFESMAINTVFGEKANDINISSTKSMTGHLLGAAAAIEAVATVLAIYNSKIPPTINYKEPDPDCTLNYTPNKSVDRKIRYALSNSFGFGGHNASLLFKNYSE